MLKIETNNKKLPNHNFESCTKYALLTRIGMDKNKINNENHTCLSSLLKRQNEYNPNKNTLSIFRNIVIFNYFSLLFVFNSVNNNQ